NRAQHDVIVIGGGPGGYAAALYGAGIGLDVGLIEKGTIGGTCLHVGCIPAKELLETAHVFRTVRDAADFGVNASPPELDWSVTMARKQRIVDQLVAGLGTLLEGRKVTVYDGVGSLGADRRVTVTGGDGSTATLTAPAVVIATGSLPRTIPGFEVDGRLVVTSDEVLSIDALPARAAVIGGGAIGCEFASMMGDLGVEVTVLEALPQILTGCDPDATRVVERSFKKRGITVRTGVTVHGHTPDPSGGFTTVAFGDGESVDVETVVVSVGRRPNPDLLGLEGTAVQLDERGFVEIDERCR
ncbi:MAG: FAD-dependent oxidoreductase, partial [Actinobacteria bacterium]|nr:FAD-dependent oxidoreductase [Actinomycetota bacterium]NIS31641.1 FAD-dependent oxidoreductase [Actinomycetota bacterium]NIT98666.1 FAD-dependent oxidoreductase [Actinomycetota bacterium]NIU21994.1 FAD-dependent oxidoreductase [Actinomycetota bacterium]NIU66755.1 FAD-dependent oxidoreductase [Actinomycetota bacterium]